MQMSEPQREANVSAGTLASTGQLEIETMPMIASDIERLIKMRIPDAQVTVAVFAADAGAVAAAAASLAGVDAEEVLMAYEQ